MIKKLLLVLFVTAILTLLFLSQRSGSQIKKDNPKSSPTATKISPVAKNLDVPWALAFLPDQNLLITERTGNIKLFIKEKTLIPEPIFTNDISKDVGEGGLLGIAVHPDFNSNGYVYIYYTYSENNTNTLNRVSRYKYTNVSFGSEKIIVDKIPGSANHNGGRIKFSPDGLLYITTGDAQNPSQSQDKNSLAGKILRIKDDGSIPSDNPFGNAVYSYGHRNPQGITWDANENLWETEHGPSGGTLGTGNDELNLIKKGGNYGWPTIQGNQEKDGMIAPIINSTPNATWAPAGLAYASDSLFFGGLRGTALYEYNLENKKLTEHFKNNYGRIRDVVLGPDGLLYFTTSNRDGRGFPSGSDDQVIRVDPKTLK